MPARLTPVFEELEQALHELRAESLAPPRAQAMASVARAMVQVLTAGEFEERVRRLERVLQES